MLNPSTRLRLREILDRIGNDLPVSLQERITLQKFADRDQRVADWLRQARRQRNQAPGDGLDRLLEGLNLGSGDPEAPFRSSEDDLGDWFGGAPSWLRRS